VVKEGAKINKKLHVAAKTGKKDVAKDVLKTAKNFIKGTKPKKVSKELNKIKAKAKTVKK